MTPAERDAVRRIASGLEEYAAGLSRSAFVETVEAQDLHRLIMAVLAFVPPGDAKAPEGYEVDFDTDDGKVTLCDAEYVVAEFEADDAERLAWALLAAVATAATARTAAKDSP